MTIQRHPCVFWGQNAVNQHVIFFFAKSQWFEQKVQEGQCHGRSMAFPKTLYDSPRSRAASLLTQKSKFWGPFVRRSFIRVKEILCNFPGARLEIGQRNEPLFVSAAATALVISVMYVSLQFAPSRRCLFVSCVRTCVRVCLCARTRVHTCGMRAWQVAYTLSSLLFIDKSPLSYFKVHWGGLTLGKCKQWCDTSPYWSVYWLRSDVIRGCCSSGRCEGLYLVKRVETSFSYL